MKYYSHSRAYLHAAIKITSNKSQGDKALILLPEFIYQYKLTPDILFKRNELQP